MVDTNRGMLFRLEIGGVRRRSKAARVVSHCRPAKGLIARNGEPDAIGSTQGKPYSAAAMTILRGYKIRREELFLPGSMEPEASAGATVRLRHRGELHSNPWKRERSLPRKLALSHGGSRVSRADTIPRCSPLARTTNDNALVGLFDNPNLHCVASEAVECVAFPHIRPRLQRADAEAAKEGADGGIKCAEVQRLQSERGAHLGLHLPKPLMARKGLSEWPTYIIVGRCTPQVECATPGLEQPTSTRRELADSSFLLAHHKPPTAFCAVSTRHFDGVLAHICAKVEVPVRDRIRRGGAQWRRRKLKLHARHLVSGVRPRGRRRLTKAQGDECLVRSTRHVLLSPSDIELQFA
eukprot:scaffold117574_cov32-Tisochrysis_lutea.AAC.1